MGGGRRRLAWFQRAVSRIIAGIRVGNWKLLVDCDSAHWRHEGDALYNLERDPGEANNVANENPEKVEELKAKLRAFEQELSQNMRSAGHL